MPRAKRQPPAEQFPDGADTSVVDGDPVESKPVEAADLTAANAEIAKLRGLLAASQQQARTRPVRLPAPEMHTADVPEPALRDIEVPPLGQEVKRGDSQIVLPDSPLPNAYLDELKFMEEPVTIRLEPSPEENAAWTIDCWVNNKGAEIWNPTTKKWMEMNCLPVGLVVTTKRKYVEVLARSKSMRVRTPDHADGKNVDNNTVTRNHARTAVFSIIRDTDRGVAWMTRLLNEAF